MNVRQELPPYVYVPCRPGEGDGGLDPETMPVAAGTGLLVYTALDRLWRVHGIDKQWIVLPLPAISELRQKLDLRALLIDDGLPEHERWNVTPLADA